MWKIVVDIKCGKALLPLVLTANKEAIQVLVGENSCFGGYGWAPPLCHSFEQYRSRF